MDDFNEFVGERKFFFATQNMNNISSADAEISSVKNQVTCKIKLHATYYDPIVLPTLTIENGGLPEKNKHDYAKTFSFRPFYRLRLTERLISTYIPPICRVFVLSF